jgi:8-oxo-dGTP pyrophosphatase MutT (NUDIX family)
MPITPWKKIGSPRTLAEGYGKRLDVQKFTGHDGKVILPVTKDGKVVMVRHFKPGSETIMEELPGGQADFENETPEQVIRRELREETGYEAGEIISLGSAHYDSGSSHAKFYCFLAKDCEYKGGEEFDATEEIERVEKPLPEWLTETLTGASDQWDAALLTLRALPHLGVDISDIIKKHPLSF